MNEKSKKATANENRSDKIISAGLRKNIEILYQENVRIHLYDVESRHKIMLRFFISIAALLITAGWLWERKNIEIEAFLFLPFLIAAVMSLGYFLIDRRIVSQINLSYKIGIRLEKELFEKGGRFVGVLEARRDSAGKLNSKLSIVAIFANAVLLLTRPARHKFSRPCSNGRARE